MRCYVPTLACVIAGVSLGWLLRYAEKRRRKFINVLGYTNGAGI